MVRVKAQKVPADGSWILSKGAQGMYVMVDMSRFQLHAIGDYASRLTITQLPYCWHIAEVGGSEWAVVLVVSHSQAHTTEWLLAVTQCDGCAVETWAGGGPTKDVATEVARRINEILSQFLK